VIPVVRTFISIPAGVASMPLIRFTVYTFLGSLPWSWLLTLAGVRLGAHWSEIRSAMHGLDTLVIAVVVAAVLYWIVRVASRSVRR
jgi:membrane protein DedA with SNARE-associated domain